MSATDDHQDWRVGELADATGLTVRTLHHYEGIGLLAASGRTSSGHRRYGRADVERLYRICSLRRLGLSLAEIGGVLDTPDWDLAGTVRIHLADLDRRIGGLHRQQRRLLAIQAALTDHRPPRIDDLLDLLEDMTMEAATVTQRISILVYADLEAAFTYLTEVFGLGPGTLHRDGDGHVVLGELHAGDGMVWMHPESPAFRLASPKTVGQATATMAVMVHDVDAHYAAVVERGAEIAAPPVDQPYGYREYSARDGEGGLWSFMKPLEGPTP